MLLGSTPVERSQGVPLSYSSKRMDGESIERGFRSTEGGEEEEDPCPPSGRVPRSWWVGGLAASSIACTAILSGMLGLPAYEPLAALGVAGLVALLAVRALGQTDMNPVSGVGKLSQVWCWSPNLELLSGAYPRRT